MSLDCIRECADMARTSPCVQEYRTTQLTIRVTQWTSERAGQLDASQELVSELVMPKYEVREIGSREILASNGRLNRGDVRVLDISPPYTKADGTGQGGYTKEQLDPQKTWSAPDYGTPVRNRRVDYVLTGDVAGVFSLLDVETSDVTAWNLVLSNTRDSP